jgi:hypothetical protein
LIIDDDESLKEDIVESFNEENVEVVFCLTKDEALNKIDSRQYFDLIILDWFLEDPEDSMLSQLVLSHLYDKRFLPVFIWSKHIDDFNSVKDAGKIKYPNILIEGISKDEITADQLKVKVRQLLENSLTAQISRVYRVNIADNLEKTFFELAEIPNKDMASILKILVGSEENIDWSNDFILNLIHRRLLADPEFIEKLRTLMLVATDSAGMEGLEKRRKIVNKVLYFHSTPSIIRCGDIIELKVDGNTLKYGVIITPDCDIEQKRTRYLEAIELKKIDDAELRLTASQKENIALYKNDSFYYFPSVSINGDLSNDFVAILKAKFIIEALCEVNEEKYPGVPQRLSYSERYLFKNKEVQLVHICSKSNPYKSDFLQKLYANNSRVGTPDIKDLLKP